MSSFEELYQQIQDDPNTKVDSSWVDDWLSNLGNKTDQYHYLEGKTIDMIQEEKDEMIRDYPEYEYWNQSLSMYRAVNHLQDLRLGFFVRWIKTNPDGSYKLFGGGTVVQTQFTTNGTYVLCKRGLSFMRFRLDECPTFQKITAEEWLVLMANSQSSHDTQSLDGGK
jgi:hypothetical protein